MQKAEWGSLAANFSLAMIWSEFYLSLSKKLVLSETFIKEYAACKRKSEFLS
ncbi:MAG: hypothetical protein RL214_1108 [Pseudomonadota bacterium]|jgi:hypothetical protein